MLDIRSELQPRPRFLGCILSKIDCAHFRFCASVGAVMAKRVHDDALEGVSDKIQRLWRSRKRLGSSDKQLLIEDIKHEVHNSGVDHDDLTRLFDIIFEDSTPSHFSALQKKYMIKALCIFSTNNTILDLLLDRILSNIGEPKMYYVNGTRTKQSRLPRSIQIELLDWLLCSLHLFGPKIVDFLYRRLPILLHLLSYEYSRRYISQLVFVGLMESGGMFHGSNNGSLPLKKWHIKLVLDLHLKFPLDEHLKLLLCLFTKIDPALDYRRFTDGKPISISTSGSLFRIPDDEFFNISSAINNNFHRSTSNYLLQQFSNFDQLCRNKRGFRKIDFEPSSTLNENEVSITDIYDIEGLIRNFNRISYPNSWLVLRLRDHSNYSVLSTKIKLIYVTLRLLAGDEKLQSEMLYFMKTSLQDNIEQKEASLYYDRLNRLFAISAGIAAPDLNADFLQDTLQNIIHRISLMKFETVADSHNFGSKLLLPPQCQWDSQHHFSQVILLWLIEFTSFIKWWLQDLQDQNFDQTEVVLLLNTMLGAVFTFLSEHIANVDLTVQVLSVYLFKFIESMDEQLFGSLSDGAVLFPPILHAKMLLCKHPFVISGYCDYLLKLKNRQFSSETAKLLYTTALLDTLNYLWRDKALEIQSNEKVERSQVLSLHRSMIDKLGMLPTFGYSNILERSTSGNLFHNPSFAYISCQIVRRIEDKANDIETRHDGPIKRASVLQLNASSDVKWIGMNYDEVKVAVLSELEESGFHGLCNLIYQSISSLVDKRK